MAITSVFKNVIIYLRTWIKLIIMFLIGLSIIGFIVFVVYKPMYSVSLDGEFIGYTEDKRKLQKKINNYLDSGDDKTVAFVEVDNYPEYKLCLLQKGLTANDNEIFEKVVSSGVTYYKYYAIIDNGEEKYYVSTYKEVEEIIEGLKEKNSQNKSTITFELKYETELKEFTDTETAVASLYIKMPTVKKQKVLTPKVMDNTYTPISIGLIEPVQGTITSRFGRRKSGNHSGLDIATSSGTPIKAASAGVVISAGWRNAYGNLVIIAHTDSIQTYYAHCSKIYVSEGQTVNQGDVIAAIGSTGRSTGPHLHLEIRENGVAKNPQNYLYLNR